MTNSYGTVVTILSIFAMAVFIPITLSSCTSTGNNVNNSSNVTLSVLSADKSEEKSENRKLSPFTKIDAAGRGDLIINLDASKPQNVRVEANGKSLSGITTIVDNGTLKIQLLPGINPNVVRIQVDANALDELQNSGAFHTNVNLGNSGKSKDLKMNVSGATNVTIKGQLNSFDLTVSGASMVVAREVRNNYCHATVSGASSAALDGSNKVDATASGASHITLYATGRAGQITQNCSGASRIEIKTGETF